MHGRINELEWTSQQTPCSNFYNLDTSVLSKTRKIPMANMKRDMVVRSPEPKPELIKAPSPHSYPDKDKNWKTLSHQESVPRFSIKKDKNTFLVSHVKNKKYVPGPGTYKDNETINFDKLARGPSPHYKRGR